MEYASSGTAGNQFPFPMIFIKGTGDAGYLFGDSDKVNIQINDFYISQYPVTQNLWNFVTGNNPSHFKGANRPVESVSFPDITQEGGFLEKFNALARLNTELSPSLVFRLPAESEWEYAARGGVHWRNGYTFSGSNDMDSAGWYELNAGKLNDSDIISRLKNQEKGTSTQEVGQKLPNQLGIYDLCGNVWEWCEDFYQPNIHAIPKDGSPYTEVTGERVLRGGCHHNGAIYCTVSKRYAITPDAADECIGFRIAASI